MTPTQTPEEARRRVRGHGPDRSELFTMLHDGLLPDIPAFETLLDRIEHREVAR